MDQEEDFNDELRKAAAKGDLALCKSFIEKGADVDDIDIRSGLTALHEAVCGSHVELITYFLSIYENDPERKENLVNIVDKEGDSLLSLACMLGNLEIVKQLCSAGALPQIQGSSGQTALHEASANGFLEIIAHLCFTVTTRWKEAEERKKERKAKLPEGENDEAEEGNVIKLSEFLELKNIQGWTALHYAAWMEHVGVVRLLLDGGGVKGEQRGMRRRGANSLAKTKEKKLPIDLVGKNNQLPQSEASKEKQEDIRKLLLNAVKMAQKRNSVSLTLGRDEKERMITAAREGDIEECRSVLNRSVAGVKGYTALHDASWKGHTSIVELLLDRGAKIDTKDDDGYTALIYAAWKGNRGVVDLLLHRGADVNAVDKEGQTALHWASFWGRTEVRDLLKEHGAKEIENRKGETPLALTAAGSENPRQSWGAGMIRLRSHSLAPEETIEEFAFHIDRSEKEVTEQYLNEKIIINEEKKDKYTWKMKAVLKNKLRLKFNSDDPAEYMWINMKLKVPLYNEEVILNQSSSNNNNKGVERWKIVEKEFTFAQKHSVTVEEQVEQDVLVSLKGKERVTARLFVRRFNTSIPFTCYRALRNPFDGKLEGREQLTGSLEGVSFDQNVTRLEIK